MSSDALELRYDPRTVWPDLARGGAGLAVTAAPLPWLTGSPVAFVILVCLASAFAVFLVSTGRRLRTVVRVDDAGISTSGIRTATVSWDKMQAVDLSYFSTRRDRERGWMQLRVRGSASTIRVDSTLEDFTSVASRAIAAARLRDVTLSEATLANMSALAAGGLNRPVGDHAHQPRYR